MGVKKKSSNQNIKISPLRLRTQSGGTRATNQAARSADMQQRIWQTVAMIPTGKVATYGQIASLIGFPAHSRFVGTTLRQLPKNTKLPWFRVVNSSLRISLRGGGEKLQRRLLEADNITFIGERIAKAHQWEATAS